MKTLFAKHIVNIINQQTISDFFHGLYDQLKKDFSRWHDFRIQPRIASHFPNGVIELMPTTTAETYAVKFVNGHPENTKSNLPNIIGFGALADTNTGIPFLLSDMTILTAFRTAVTSALAAHYLARKDAKTMAIIGTGAQSEFQALAFHYIHGIDTIKFFDIDQQAMKKFQTNLEKTDTLKLTECASIQEATTDADIITTATAAKKHAKILKHDMVAPGTFINGIGGDCPGKTELHEILQHVDMVAVDYLQQAKIEGEIQHLDNHSNIAELRELVSNKKPGRQNNKEIILFDSVGCAIEDFSALTYIHSLAEKYQIGFDEDFIPKLNDPKDLYGILEI